MPDIIKLEAKNTTPFDKIKNGVAIAAELQADPDAEVQVTGNEVGTVSAQLDNAEKAQTDAEKEAIDKTKKAVKAAENYDTILKKAANKLEETYPDNPDKYVEKKFKIRDNTITERPKPPKVENLKATAGDAVGEADLIWEPLGKEVADGYYIQINTTDPIDHNEWRSADPVSVSSSKATIVGLTPGQKYWVRVTGFAPAGRGTASDEDDFIAP